jgi:hypothetical protein
MLAPNRRFGGLFLSSAGEYRDTLTGARPPSHDQEAIRGGRQHLQEDQLVLSLLPYKQQEEIYGCA